MSFFNTTNETGDLLAEYRSKSEHQDERVLKIFEGSGQAAALSPSMVSSLYDRLYSGSTPLTSIRRSITCLTKEGKLEKTSEKRPGLFRRPEFLWKLASAGLSVEPGQESEPSSGQEADEKNTISPEPSQGLGGKQGSLFQF